MVLMIEKGRNWTSVQEEDGKVVIGGRLDIWKN
jgi:hypothetical protein